MKENYVLELKDIVKVYGVGQSSVQALNGVSLKFRNSEFVSILGPSGCGKTTLLNIIGGLDRYTSGDLVINGVSTKKFQDGDWDAYRNNSIGFVFQSYNLIGHQTVLSNVELALTLSGVSNSERKKRAREVLEKVGLKDQENKLPAQLSGGQMQRVAIARALVNDPDIILADEPTGALDTETSVQVMELLKEVSKDRLVIMVTHNPELADKYSTRIINMLDGVTTNDKSLIKTSEEKGKKVKNTHKTAMSFLTALSLSFSNLRTKRGRTILTSIAGSIGIIGIALVLAVSTGFSAYVSSLQTETLSVYPITISKSQVDLEDFDKLMDSTGLEKFPTVKEVATREMFSNLTGMLKSNDISKEYLSYVTEFADTQNALKKNSEQGWDYAVVTTYGMDINNHIFSDIVYGKDSSGNLLSSVIPVDTLVKSLENQMKFLEDSDMNITTGFVRQYIPTMCEIPDTEGLVKSQYELIHGDWATRENELLLVVDQYNRVSDITMALLGFRYIDSIETKQDGVNVVFGGEEKFTFNKACEKEFYYIDNDNRYIKSPLGYTQKMFKVGELPENTLTLKIKGIVRLKQGVKQGVLSQGIAYTSKFVQTVLEDSKVGTFADEVTSSGGTVNVQNPLIAGASMSMTAGFAPYTAMQLGIDDTIKKLSVYSYDYTAKQNLKAHLDKWNEPYQAVLDNPNSSAEELEENEKKIVHYSDATESLFSALNTIVDSVKIVLVCFTAISLVVSSIMIGIITYVSVVERTKEIGVLRAIGARKKDIGRIFNAESFLIGLFAGLFGIGISYLLSIPINLIISSLIVGANSIVSLKITDALILVAVSFILTMTAGLMPSRIAAKKDPVVALRSE